MIKSKITLRKRNYSRRVFILFTVAAVLTVSIGWGVMAKRTPAQVVATPCLGPNFTPGFTNGPDFPVGSVPNSIAVGDFNGDGIQDLAIANRSPDNSVSIRLGNGSGGFTTMPQVAVGADPVSIVIGDFNGDGFADFITANQNSNNVSIRLGNGVGGFTSPAVPEIATNGRPTTVLTADFDRDGKQDFAVNTVGAVSGPIISAPTAVRQITIDFGNGNGGFIRHLVVLEGPIGDIEATLFTFIATKYSFDTLTVSYRSFLLIFFMVLGD